MRLHNASNASNIGHLYNVTHHVAIVHMAYDKCQASNVGAGTHSAACRFVCPTSKDASTLEAICLDIFIRWLHDAISNWCLDAVNTWCYSNILLRIVNWFCVDVRILFNIMLLNLFCLHKLFQRWFQHCNSTFVVSCSRCLKHQHWT